MKRFANFIRNKVLGTGLGEYLVYTFIFTGLMVGIYLYLVFAGQMATPKFTYAEF